MKESYKKTVEYITHFFIRNSIERAPHKATKSWLSSIIFSVFVALMLCVIGVFTYFFSKSADVVAPITSTGTPVSFSEARLQTVVEQYKEQVIGFTELRYSVPTAPSIGVVEVVEENFEEEIDEAEVEEGEEEVLKLEETTGEM